jgi:glycosyltransferase involved in cell wall biosynthesis
VIVPAHNEALTIVESVRALLALDYEPREIVVVNDGSSDDTLVVLQGAFHLLAAPVAFAQPLPSETVRGIYRSMDEPALVVIDKANGGKADAINAGINAAAGRAGPDDRRRYHHRSGGVATRGAAVPARNVRTTRQAGKPRSSPVSRCSSE